MGNTVLPAKDLYVGTYQVMESDDGSLYQQGVKVTASAAELNALANEFTEPVIDDGDDGVTLTSADQTNAAAVVTIPDIGDAADTFVMCDTTQTLTAKTLTSPTLTTPLIDDTDTGITITSADQTHAAPTVTIPDIVDAADSFVMNDTAASLTNKILTAPTITSPNVTLAVASHDYAAGVVDWTLSAAELKAQILEATNASGAVNIIAPAEIREYRVINSTGEALTIKKAAGTGVQIGNGKAAIVAYTGSDYVRITADA